MSVFAGLFVVVFMLVLGLATVFARRGPVRYRDVAPQMHSYDLGGEPFKMPHNNDEVVIVSGGQGYVFKASDLDFAKLRDYDLGAGH